MWLRLAALAAFMVVPVAYAQTGTAPTSTLTLDDAISRVATTHPDLRIFEGRRQVLDANLAAASLKPGLTLGGTIENTMGTGAYRGFSEAELTVTLAGVFERGGKLEARRTLALANIDTLAPQREVARLDLLAETARRYLAVTAATRRKSIADLDITQRKRAVEAARVRLNAGASPESVVLTAQAALANAELDRDRAIADEKAARQNLAALWNERTPNFTVAAGNPLVLPDLQSFDALSSYLQNTPELAELAGAERVREAQVRLARTEATPNIDWQVGARNNRANGDTGFTAGFSIPLGSARRAAPGIRAAEAELALTALERESLQIDLYSTLTNAYGDYTTSQLEVSRLRTDVIPRLEKAEKAAEYAWKNGAISYLEWSQLQAQRVEASVRQLQVAIDAQSALIEIQRLTGQPIVASGTTTP
ncbi:TolC family protein [Pseudoxanthomonas mexicana]